MGNVTLVDANQVPFGTPSSPFAIAPGGTAYSTVAASQTDHICGSSGAIGDLLTGIVIQPVTTAAGAVVVKDGNTVIFTFTAGTLSDLKPLPVPFGIKSVVGAFKVTTGANVVVIATGAFT